MKKIFLLLNLMLLLLTGCVPLSTTKIADEYKDKEIDFASLTVVLNRSDIKILNEDDVDDDLGKGDSKEVFREFYKNRIVNSVKIKSTFAYVQMANIPYDNNFTVVPFKLGKESEISLHIPKDDYLTKNGIKTEYVLFLENMEISRNSKTNITYNVGGGISSSGSEWLNYKVNAFIWDNTEKKVVSYGTYSSQSTFLAAMTKGDWEYCQDLLFKEIFNKTPFWKNIHVIKDNF